MSVNRVLAGVAVADIDAALTGTSGSSGRPADALPTEALPSGTFPSGGDVQLVADRERAGRSLLTLHFDDLEYEGVMRKRASTWRTGRDDVRQGLDRYHRDPERNAIPLVEQR